ncbi:MAG: large-conductance mechanosensitive channel protein MscL [Labilithrix sp.]|nr:large-conductance mechanosensitive channel protein MscL [Labilithrix sp.]MCW5811350.1 large-conductance mechanosensitive channel protein MscL [Labilithrix sp.]
MSFFKEFREFALKGNFVDLAVGVIIGAASGNVVKALTDKVLMPPIGLITGRVNFSELKYVLQPAETGPDGKEVVKEVAIGYGAAIQSFIDLLIIAFIVFWIVRFMHRLLHEKPPPPPAQEVLLTEIRDLLKAKDAKAEPAKG